MFLYIYSYEYFFFNCNALWKIYAFVEIVPAYIIFFTYILELFLKASES